LVTFWGGDSFVGCSSLRTITFQSDSRLERIESGVFHGCNGLESISIPRSVTVLGQNLFADCSSLRTITFESDSRLERIDSWRFRNCERLESICIPRLVTILGGDSFFGCTSLRTVTFESDSRLSLIECGAFRGCRCLEAIQIPPSVGSLMFRCFSGCLSLHTVTFHANSHLCCISSDVFSDCRSLERIFVPSSVRFVWASAFQLCNLLHLIVFQSVINASVIPSRVFLRCRTANSACLPPSATVLFEGCGLSSGVDEQGRILIGLDCALPDLRVSARYEGENAEVGTSLTWDGLSDLNRSNAEYRLESVQSICVPCCIDVFRPDCFGSCNCRRFISFESTWRLEGIGSGLSLASQSLELIYIPAAVVIVPHRFFAFCHSLRMIRLGPNSTLVEVSADEFGD
jgi:hypothetical protein